MPSPSTREQMPGAVVGQLAQHLIADGRDAVVRRRRGDQRRGSALVGVGEAPCASRSKARSLTVQRVGQRFGQADRAPS